MLFHYEDIQWTEDRLSIGFNAGDTVRGFNLLSTIEGTAFDLPNLSNVGIPGVFYFRVDQNSIILPSGEHTCM